MPVAIKIIDFDQVDDGIDLIIQEIAILSRLSSDFVTKYYGSYVKGRNKPLFHILDPDK
jgi:serine/threonine-protein kinase 24/25/MST4